MPEILLLIGSCLIVLGVVLLCRKSLAIIALSLWLIVFLGLTCVVFAFVSMWKENRSGSPIRGIIWFTIVIAGSCAVIAVLAGKRDRWKRFPTVRKQRHPRTSYHRPESEAIYSISVFISRMPMMASNLSKSLLISLRFLRSSGPHPTNELLTTT